MRTLIISGGCVSDDFVRRQYENACGGAHAAHGKEPFGGGARDGAGRTSAGCRVIAADRGWVCCQRLGIVPDYVIGDFDSLPGDDARKALAGAWEFAKADSPAGRTEYIALNPEKDDTDTEAALRLALERTADDIVILGGTGSRIDHVLANISVLGLGLSLGRRVELLDEHNRIWLAERPFLLERKDSYGDYVSLIPFTAQVSGITLEGFKYPLSDAVMGPFTSVGVSNEIVADVARVDFREGIFIVIESKD